MAVADFTAPFITRPLRRGGNSLVTNVQRGVRSAVRAETTKAGSPDETLRTATKSTSTRRPSDDTDSRHRPRKVQECGLPVWFQNSAERRITPPSWPHFTVRASDRRWRRSIRAAYIEPYTSADPQDLHPALSRYPLADYDWAELWTHTGSLLGVCHCLDRGN